MTAENRATSYWIETENPKDYFDEVVSSAKLHVKLLEKKEISPQVISVAVHEFILKNAPSCRVTRSSQSPFTVSLSYDKYEARIYSDTKIPILSEMKTAVNGYSEQWIMFLLTLEDSVSKASAAVSSVKDKFVSEEEKCIRNLKQVAQQSARDGQSFKELLAAVSTELEAHCEGAVVQTDKYNDVYILINGSKYRIYTNDTYEYPGANN